MKKLEAVILPVKFDNVRIHPDRFGIRDESTVTRVKQGNGNDRPSLLKPQAVAMNNNQPPDFVKQLSRSRFYQDYEQAFGKTTKLPLELSPIEMGREVHCFRSKYANPFCAILARTSKICAACLEVQRKLTSPNISDTQTVRCFAGLTVTSVPVKLEERVIAFLQTGQVFLRTPSAKRFQKIASQLIRLGMKANLVRLKVAYFQSRMVSPGLYRATV